MVRRTILGLTYLYIMVYILIPINVFASGYADTFGASPKGLALGNAMTARVNDWSSPYYNIAGLGKTVHLYRAGLEDDKIQKNQFAVAYLYNYPDFDIDIDAPGGERYYYLDGELTVAPTEGDEYLDTGTIVVGLALDINKFYVMPDIISSARFGLILGLNDDFSVMKINDLDPRTHNFLRYGRESQTMLLMSGFGFGFMNDTIGFGLGINTTFKGDGDILLENVSLTSTAQQPASVARMNTELSSALIAGGYFSPGKVIPALKGVDFGLSVKTEKYLTIDSINILQHLETATEDIPLIMEIVLFDYYQPLIVTAGGAYTLNNLILSCDIEYQKWSDFKLSGTKMDNYIGVFPDMEDIVVIKLGAEYAVRENIHLLTGYSYQPTYVPDDAITGPYNYLDNDKHIGSVGVSYTLPAIKGVIGTTTIVGAYQVQFLTERDVVKGDPTQEILDVYGTAENYTLINPGYSFGGICHSVFMGLNISI